MEFATYSAQKCVLGAKPRLIFPSCPFVFSLSFVTKEFTYTLHVVSLSKLLNFQFTNKKYFSHHRDTFLRSLLNSQILFKQVIQRNEGFTEKVGPIINISFRLPRRRESRAHTHTFFSPLTFFRLSTHLHRGRTQDLQFRNVIHHIITCKIVKFRLDWVRAKGSHVSLLRETQPLSSESCDSFHEGKRKLFFRLVSRSSIYRLYFWLIIVRLTMLLH